LVFAHVNHSVGQVLCNVKVKQLLTQVEFLAGRLDSFGVFVDLEEEKHVVFVDASVILVNQAVNFLLDLAHSFFRAGLLGLGFRSESKHV
jgi:hypothetical protein